MQIQNFNMLMFISIAAGIYGAVIGAIINNSMYPGMICLLMFVTATALLIAAERRKAYRLCTWLYVISIFFIVLPALFFTCGGYRSGAFLLFGIPIVFSSILLHKFQKSAVIAMELLLYVACILIAYFKPETVRVLQSEFDYVFLSIVFFLSTSVFLLAALMTSARMLTLRQEWIEELNRELTARSETLQQYDNMKSDFLATVAHEINTPLAVISASSNDTLELLGEKPLNIDEVRENQNIINKRVKLIDTILLDLMDTVAIETGRLTLQRMPVSLAELIRDTCNAHYEKLTETGKHVECDLQEDLPLIWIDPPRIEQVMLNLMSNALRYSRSGTVTVRLEQANDGQTVSVIDDGEGMDSNTARDALRQYATTSAEHWRHGIGLYICRRIITAHNGSIWINSKKGSGTTVSFSLNEDPADY